jgi:hypothetical protein
MHPLLRLRVISITEVHEYSLSRDFPESEPATPPALRQEQSTINCSILLLIFDGSPTSGKGAKDRATSCWEAGQRAKAKEPTRWEAGQKSRVNCD